MANLMGLTAGCEQSDKKTAELEAMQINLFYKPKVFRSIIVEIKGVFSTNYSAAIGIDSRI